METKKLIEDIGSDVFFCWLSHFWSGECGRGREQWFCDILRIHRVLLQAECDIEISAYQGTAPLLWHGPLVPDMFPLDPPRL